jgi:ABC-type uncharacterized transport system permease subunit
LGQALARTIGVKGICLPITVIIDWIAAILEHPRIDGRLAVIAVLLGISAILTAGVSIHRLQRLCRRAHPAAGE